VGVSIYRAGKANGSIYKLTIKGTSLVGSWQIKLRATISMNADTDASTPPRKLQTATAMRPPSYPIPHRQICFKIRAPVNCPSHPSLSLQLSDYYRHYGKDTRLQRMQLLVSLSPPACLIIQQQLDRPSARSAVDTSFTSQEQMNQSIHPSMIHLPAGTLAPSQCVASSGWVSEGS